MFPATPTQRQVAATLVLLGVTVVPTLLVAAWIWHVTRPEHARDLEFELARMLNRPVSVAKVSHPRPNETILESFAIDSPSDQPAAPRAHADRLHWVADDESLNLRVETLHLRVDSLFDSAAWVDALADRLLQNHKRINLIAGKLIIEPRAGHWKPIELKQFALVSNSNTAERRLLASLQLENREKPTRHELVSARSLAPGDPSWTITWSNHEGALPAFALASLCDLPAWIGAKAELDGSLSFQLGSDPAAWQIAFKGKVHNLDLNALITNHFAPRRLTGQATLEVEHARWGPLPSGQGPGWIAAKGRLLSDRGLIDLALYQGLKQHLRFSAPQTNPAISSENSVLSFDALGLEFELEPDGQLHLAGALDGGAVLSRDDTDPGMPLLQGPTHDAVANVRGLWKALFPLDDDVLVPASQETTVMRHLPLPKAGSQTPGTTRAN